ncbi:MAG: tetratricopeptide repeat protein, partial [Candidatus Poribacteria bacterium]|nr:tetratricopeptide repeat protein [Candidatus Poribacteria bacterium]
MLNQSSSPDSLLSSVLEIIRKITEKLADSTYIYRGEPTHYPKICSSLYREYQDIETDSFDIETLQMEILTEAKDYTDETSDLNILMDIQRYGGKTNLIEFTTDYLIALFFACVDSSDKDGRVILQKIEEIKDIIYNPLSKPHGHVSIQKIVFIRPPKGFIQPNASDVITIPHNLKQSILDHLQKAHGISTKTIYNDLYGFVMTHNIHHSAYTEYHRGLTWQHRGIEASTSEEKQNAFDKAIMHYNEALALKSNDAVIYYNRGLVHFNIDEYDNAISDYTKAIELKPDYVDAYHHRGLTYLNNGQYDNAISDYTKAIELKPDY